MFETKGARRAGWGAGGVFEAVLGQAAVDGRAGPAPRAWWWYGGGGASRPRTWGADPGDRRSKGLRRDRPGTSHSSEASAGAREGGAEREGGRRPGAGPEGPAGPGQAPASDRQDRRRHGAAWGSGEMGLTPQKLPWAAEACVVEPPVAQATRGDGGRGRPGSTEATGADAAGARSQQTQPRAEDGVGGRAREGRGQRAGTSRPPVSPCPRPPPGAPRVVHSQRLILTEQPGFRPSGLCPHPTARPFAEARSPS